MSDTTVAILAGGQGSRLGGIDKGLAMLAQKKQIKLVSNSAKLKVYTRIVGDAAPATA